MLPSLADDPKTSPQKEQWHQESPIKQCIRYRESRELDYTSKGYNYS